MRARLFLCTLVVIGCMVISLVHCQTVAQQLEALKQQREDRVLYSDLFDSLQSFASQASSQLASAKKEKESIVYSSLDYTKVNISDTSFSRFIKNSQKKIQYLYTLVTDNMFLFNSTSLYYSYRNTQRSSVLTGYESNIKTHTWPMETTNKVYTGTVPNVTYTSSVFNSVLYQTIPSNRTANYLTSYSRANTVFRKRNRISANRWGGLFLSGNGSLYSWGFDPNYSGPTYLLGRSSSTNSPSITTPVELALASDEQILQFVSGEGHHLVLTNKAIWGWGYNNYGQLGDGTNTNRVLPVQIITHSGTIDFIETYSNCSFYITNGGDIYAWGRNTEGQLGINTLVNVNVPTKTVITGVAFTKVCAGLQHAIARTTSGAFYYWGTTANSNIPTTSKVPTLLSFTSFVFTNVIDFVCGEYHTLFLMNDGKVYSWGYGGYGATGQATSANSASATLISTTNIGTTRKAVKIFAGFQQSAVLFDDGSVFTFGKNEGYQLQLGSISTIYTPTQALSNGNIIFEIVMTDTAMYAMYSSPNGNYLRIAGGGCPSERRQILGICTSSGLSTLFDLSFQFIPYTQRKYPSFVIGSQTHFLMDTDYVGITTSNGVSQSIVSADGSTVTLSTTGLFPGSIYNTHTIKIGAATYFMGGMINNTLSDAIIVNDGNNKWTILSESLPYAVAGGMAAIVDDYFYIFGGLIQITDSVDFPFNINKLATKSIIRANLLSITLWEQLPQQIPFAIHSGHIAAISGTLYIFGGKTEPDGVYHDILTAPLYNVTNWTVTNSTISIPFFSGPFIVDADYLYMLGGFSNWGTNTFISDIIRAKKSDPLTWESFYVRINPLYSNPVPYFSGKNLYLYGNDNAILSQYPYYQTTQHSVWKVVLN